MQSIFNIFQGLKAKISSETDVFSIASLPKIERHKIGISDQRQPMFFIECDKNTTSKSLDVNLEFISVQYNRKCQLSTSKSKIKEGSYTVIALKTDSVDLQEYFLEIVFLVVKKLPLTPTVKELKIEVDKLVDLFSKFSKPATKTIQGLWAELLIIEQAKATDYLIKSWHISSSDKFDFNDGTDKIEVKSTAKSRRVHNFSMEQLYPNENSDLLIASVFVVETGVGKTIFDLLSNIEKKIKDKNLLFRINEVIAQTLGKDFEKAFDVFFDYRFAVDTLQYYNSQDINKIDIITVPREVTNIRFDSDLTDIQAVKKPNKKSQLQNALF